MRHWFPSRSAALAFGVLALAVAVAGCGAARAFRTAEGHARNGDWDTAVAYYRKAVQEDPDKPEYKIALERAMQRAAFEHLVKARDLEQKDQLDAALIEYRRATELDPSNRQAATRVIELERTIRDRIEAARPKPPIVEMRERASQATAEPLLNPTSRVPLTINFQNASLRDILNFIAASTGINIMFDPNAQVDRAFTVRLDGVTLEEALNQILQVNTLTYKVLGPRSILIYTDNQQTRARYEEQVVRTFYLSNADATELAQTLNQVVRTANLAVQPLIAPNKTANTITARGSAATMQLIERLIESNDKPRAEVVIEVEILEVNRERAKLYGLNLTQYAIGGIFSPEVAPGGTTTGTGTAATTGGTPPESVGSPPPFNLNTISMGVSTADFYLAVPAAIVRFLESDSQTKLVAKPNLRGREGEKLTLNLGEEIPVPSTAFTPLAGGGANINPLTSFQYRPIGINLELTPRVTLEGDILVDLSVESSTRGGDVTVAGTTAPSFGSRKVSTKLRLREGESNLLAGLLREDERRVLRGFPGAIRLPGFRQLLSDNDKSIRTTDIVVLLTPHVVRTSEVTQRDLDPIYIGTGLPGLAGPPQFLAPAPEVQPPAPPATPPAFTTPTPAPGVPGPPGAAAPGVPRPSPPPAVPPGSTPLPGTTAPPPPTTTTTSVPPGAPPTTTTTTTTTTIPAGVPTVPPPASPPPPPTTTTTTTTTTTAPPTAALAAAQVTITPPGTEFRVAAGPYTVPISIANANRISTITVTVSFNQAALRVRLVQAGTFLGPVPGTATFSQRVDPAVGRVDITLTRPNDVTGQSGTGLIGAIVFDAIAPGQSTFTVSGVATGPGGVQVPLQFTPVTVTVR